MNTTTNAVILNMPGFIQGPMRPKDDFSTQVTELCEKIQSKLFFYSLKFRHILKNHMDYLVKGESGIGTIEMVLILVVLIALVIVFKGRINDLLTNIFDQIDSSAQSVY